MKKSTVLFVLGTRPEAIKLAPVIAVFRADHTITTKVCVTGQHQDLLHQVLKERSITPDYDLQLMTPNQTLTYLTSQILIKLEKILKELKPTMLLVQGDTTTAMAAGLAGFYFGCRVGHVEAGLRTYNTRNPYPEEVNRQMLRSISNYHFAPTPLAYQNLIAEKVDAKEIALVGNTSIDALYEKLDQLKTSTPASLLTVLDQLDPKKKLIIATIHRKENQGHHLAKICQALKVISEKEEVEILMPLHPNPILKEAIYSQLESHNNIHMIEAVNHLTMIGLLQRAHIIITDSGGIQEEAPYLGTPTIVTRQSTERQEACTTYSAVLTGPDDLAITMEVNKLLENKDYYKKRSEITQPYGDGTAAHKILEFIKQNILQTL